MADLLELVALIDEKIFENTAGRVRPQDARDVFVAFAANLPAQEADLVALVNQNIPDNTQGLIDPDELRDVFVAFAAAMGGGSGQTVKQVTICYRIGKPTDEEPALEYIQRNDEPTVEELLTELGLTPRNSTVTSGPNILRNASDYARPLVDEYIFITYFGAVVPPEPTEGTPLSIGSGYLAFNDNFYLSLN